MATCARNLSELLFFEAAVNRFLRRMDRKVEDRFLWLSATLQGNVRGRPIEDCKFGKPRGVNRQIVFSFAQVIESKPAICGRRRVAVRREKFHDHGIQRRSLRSDNSAGKR